RDGILVGEDEPARAIDEAAGHRFFQYAAHHADLHRESAHVTGPGGTAAAVELPKSANGEFVGARGVDFFERRIATGLGDEVEHRAHLRTESHLEGGAHRGFGWLIGARRAR